MGSLLSSSMKMSHVSGCSRHFFASYSTSRSCNFIIRSARTWVLQRSDSTDLINSLYRGINFSVITWGVVLRILACRLWSRLQNSSYLVAPNIGTSITDVTFFGIVYTPLLLG